MKQVVLLLALAMATLPIACKRRESAPAGSVATDTIAPAAAQPAPTGTDAMTQTVDIEDSRSVAEGAGSTEEPSATATTGTTATTTVPPAPPTQTTTR